MKKTLIAPESPDDPATLQILHPTIEQRSDQQIATLLAVQAECRQLLAHRNEIGSEYVVVEGAQEAALKTYEMATLQLRNIVDDQPRWSISRDLYTAKMEAILDLKIKEQNARIATTESLRRPCVAFRAHIKRIVLGERNVKWCCWLGGDMPTVTDLHTFGDTAEEATQNFDHAFFEQQSNPRPEEPAAEPPARPAKPRKKK